MSTGATQHRPLPVLFSSAAEGVAMQKSRFALIGAVALACILSAWWTARAAAQDLYLAVGSSAYSDDPFCLSTNAALSDARIGVGGDAIGVSASYNNSNWPWPKPPPPPPGGLVVPGAAFSVGAAQDDHDFFLTHGDAFQAVLEFFPLGLVPGLRERTATLRRYVKPYAVQGGTDLVVAYGASANVPLGDRLGLHLQFRGNTLFAGDVELRGPDGDILISEDQRLNWGQWLIGFNIGF
jgi:hypothetical protein